MGDCMKRCIFIIVSTIVAISILMYFYEQKEALLNKTYPANNSSVHIEYPYFNNTIIDNYITNYLNKNIVLSPNNNTKLFFDYDYNVNSSKDLFNVTLYSYRESDNMYTNISKNIQVDTKNSNITANDSNNNTYYDGYKQKVIDKNKPMIALTFDDGPNHNTNRVLNILEKYNVKATFFILGSSIEGREDIIKRMHTLNMEIGNHMYSHKLITNLGSKEISKEIDKVDQQIKKITTTNPTLIRPSYGTYNKKIKTIATRPIILWNIDTLDWKYHNSKRISNTIIKKARDGNIVLMHDIYSATANSLEITIPTLLKKGYQFVTVSELFYYKNNQLLPKKVYRYAN